METTPANDVPRVSLDSLTQWHKIKTEYSEALFAQLEEHVEVEPGLRGEKEALRKHLQALIERTVASVQKNIRVNGRNFEDLDATETDMEPFDESLDRNIWSLASSRLEWDNSLAEARRTRPSEVKDDFHHALTKLDKAYEERDVKLDEIAVDDKQISDENSDQDGLQIEDALRSTHGLGQELSQAIPTQQERSQRVRLVEREIKAIKP